MKANIICTYIFCLKYVVYPYLEYIRTHKPLAATGSTRQNVRRGPPLDYAPRDGRITHHASSVKIIDVQLSPSISNCSYFSGSRSATGFDARAHHVRRDIEGVPQFATEIFI